MFSASLTILGVSELVDMVACTLDYEWPAYIVASLILLVGGLVTMLVVRYVTRWLSVSSGRLHRYHKHLLRVQEAADVILSGDLLVSKVFVSFALVVVINLGCSVVTCRPYRMHNRCNMPP